MKTHKRTVIIITLAVLIFIVAGVILYQSNNVIKIDLPGEIESVSIQSNGKNITITDAETVKEILNIVDGAKMIKMRDCESKESFAPGSGPIYLYFFTSSEQYSLSFPYWKYNDSYYKIDSRSDIIDKLIGYLPE